MSDSVILIPARFQSSRFPGKPLAVISGKSLIQRVYENCAQTNLDVYVVTDNDEIQAHVETFGKVLRVDDDVPSGSERIALAFNRNLEGKYKNIINVQGDEPLLKPETLLRLDSFHSSSNFDISTLIIKRSSTEDDFLSPDVVKAVYNEESSECSYFSRASVPHSRAGEDHNWHQHVGVYVYKVDSLEAFVKAPQSKLEKMECLEQLRALSLGHKIGALIIEEKLVGVDRPEDIKKVEEVLSE